MRDRLVEEVNGEIVSSKKSCLDAFIDDNKEEPALCLLIVKETLRMDIEKNDITVWAKVGIACIGNDLVSEEFNKWYNGA
jgi:hypothetical protein